MTGMIRSSHPEVFLGKDVLKICSKFTGGHPCRSAISIKSQSNFIEITLWHGYSPVNLLHIFRIRFPKNTSGRLLLYDLRFFSCTWVQGLYQNRGICSNLSKNDPTQKRFLEISKRMSEWIKKCQQWWFDIVFNFPEISFLFLLAIVSSITELTQNTSLWFPNHAM